ncbi:MULTISPECIES: tetratricopeptide repeat protein [unclassified Cyanobium]|uniref:tetratricopeptide repeat protein n=1 Tax=unclassified Cyanobium TaxID=2627006 RepID=UPI0020CEC171|nr:MULTISPECIES: tetratricopeptide repeat protein [unclassified Cyanobium]MCP9861297.1 tetratricopeptide repeat protein [Cyanobium sp. Cruz-8H5]MCP9868547.1 tetratricopeptide repeat protein [Cyanobium sp. Cruz-8D1]
MGGHLPAVVASGSIGIKRDPAVPELPAMDAFGLLIEEGKLHEARPLLQAALLLMLQNAPALYYLGLLASEEGDLEEARSLLNRAALASAGNVSIQPHALEALALVALQQGDRAEARRALEQVIELVPDNSFAIHSLVSLG